jgi:hypothetical protein
MDQQQPQDANIVNGGQPAKRGRTRQSKRAKDKIQAVAATLNPMASDFRQLTVSQGVEKTRQWMGRFDLVAARQDYKILSVRTLFPANDGDPQLLQVSFQGNFALEGTWPMINRALHARIVEAVDNSYEADAASQIAAGGAGPIAAAAALRPPVIAAAAAAAAVVRPFPGAAVVGPIPAAAAVRPIPAAAAVRPPATVAGVRPGPPVGARRAGDANYPIIIDPLIIDID